MARNFDLNKLPVDDVEEEMFAEVIETSFPSAKREVPESESLGLDQTRLVRVEIFIAESRVFMAPTYAACACPRLGFLPAGLIPYQPHARYPMHGSRIHTKSPTQSSSIKSWGSGIVATKSTAPCLHDAESSTN